ncbi:MAG: T9SS type A sorting domain-containing protein [Chitinophagaceae bacterium]
MNTKNLLCKAVLLSTVFAITVSASFGQAPRPRQQITKPIVANTTWSSDTTYVLKGYIYVVNNAVLTIQPGCIIYGDSTNKGALIITRGAKINAIGTASCPIVFTSAKGLNRRARGDWGGVILLGKSALNTPTGTANIEGIPPNDSTLYGGGSTPDIHDNSGTLKYVRIEFAGIALSPNNEINGLTFGAVGDGTTIDYVQVSFANDDSFEWFGGTVNCKHIIAFRGIDDDFDTDNGFSGKVQYGMGLRDPKVADVSGSKGFESDNDANGSTNLPQTRAIFCNMTATAGKDTTQNSLFIAGAHIRRNSHMYLYNSIVMGYPEGLLIDGTLSENNVLADTLVVDNFITCKDASKYVVTTPVNTSVQNLLLSSNTYYSGNKKVKLTDPYKLLAPDYRPKPTSPALGAADFNHAVLNDPFFDKVTYVGAFDQTNDWTAGWANFDPNSVDYNHSVCFGSSAKKSETIEPASTAAEVNVYPNPAPGNFKADIIGFNSTVNIKVSNMNGSVVYNTKQIVSAKTSLININLNNAPTGLYVVEISDGKNVITKKINIVK